MTTPDSLSSRKHVFQLLLPFEKGLQQRVPFEQRLHKVLQQPHIQPNEKGFITCLSNGILQDWFLLTALIQEGSRFPIEKLHPQVKLLLRLGLFQLYAMDAVPDYAAVDTTMVLATRLRVSETHKGFLHAMLQTFIRKGKVLPKDLAKRLPAWWFERLKNQLAPAEIEQILSTWACPPTLSIRVNTLKGPVSAYTQQLTKAGLTWQGSTLIPEVLWFLKPMGDPTALPGFHEGWFVVQDESAARVAPFLDPQPGETVLEIGAAPGGKTTHLAALMHNQGQIVAVDPAENRMNRLQETCTRLGVSILETKVLPGEALTPECVMADKVLLDVPCSGTGTIRKHPDILVVLQEGDFERYAQQQDRLLHSAFACLKPGGVLVYSTCSLDQAENQRVVEHFLNIHSSQAEWLAEEQILPTAVRDGFYLAKLRRKP